MNKLQHIESSFRIWKIGAPTLRRRGYGLTNLARKYGRDHAECALWWPVFERSHQEWGTPDAAPIAYVLEDRKAGIAEAHRLINTLRTPQRRNHS